MRRSLAAAIVLAVANISQAAPRAEHVVLISCDGLRPDAIEPARAVVLQGLIAGGAYQPTCVNEMPPVTLPNHASMTTGLSVVRHGVLANTGLPGRIAATTIMDVATAAGLRVGFFITKGKLSYLCEPDAVAVWKVASDVDALATEVVTAIETDAPDLMFVHLKEPDSSGHREGWMSEPYFEGIRRSDAAIGRILEALTAAGLRDQTAIIVTADHGGHGMTHFLDIPDDRLIPFIIQGPGIAVGRRLNEQIRIMDAAATALDLLGLPIASAVDGRVVTEAYAEVTPSTTTPATPPIGFPCLALPVLFVCAAVVACSVQRRRHEKPCA